MRVIILISFFAMFTTTSNISAIESIDDQQATFYYQIPFGEVKKSDNSHKFGFRIDRITIDRASSQDTYSISFNDLMKKPASLDIQMGYHGIAAFKMHGYNYLPHLVNKAGEKDGGVVAPEEKQDKEFPEFSDVLDQTTVGLIFGAVIGIIALTGSGG